ncbi:MAG: DegT/DnrJ/EryC1/StrS family aminotransferase [Planctomycetota bacterium]
MSACERVIDSGYYILGPDVQALEEECAEFLGNKFAIGVSSGSDALLLALMALCIGPGDEVLCPSFTFFATAGAVWRLGAKPVFCDVDPLTLNLDPEEIVRKTTDKTRAVIPVHLYGRSADMDPILSLCKERGLRVIEDAAQSYGATYKGRQSGSMGDFGAFSFFPTKNLGGLGDGGLVSSDDPEIFEMAKIMRVHGGAPKYHHKVVGGNFRIDTLQAACLRVKAKYLTDAIDCRRRNADLYRQGFEATGLVQPYAALEAGAIALPPHDDPGQSWNQYCIRVGGGRQARDAMRQHFVEQGVGSEVYYPIPLHLQECFQHLGGKPGDLPISEQASEDVMALPIFPELTEGEIAQVVETVSAFCTAKA